MSLLFKIRAYKKIAIVMAGLLIFQICFPVAALALTSGPTQPEFSEFEPVGTSQMVDLFSGDFVYNIPLFELPGPDGGYPFNLAYHSGVTMDQEATWVGLGWSLNSGAINRTMRGIPDDFDGEDGDEIQRLMEMKPNKTTSYRVEPSLELWGATISGLNPGLTLINNNYKGWGASLDLSLFANTGNFSNKKYSFKGGLGLGLNTFDGASLQPSLSFGKIKQENTSETNPRMTISSKINSRDGISNFDLGYNKKISKVEYQGGEFKYYKQSISGTSTYSFGKSDYSPQVGTAYSGLNLSTSVQLGGDFFGTTPGSKATVSFNRQKLKNNGETVSAPAYGYFNMKHRGSLSDDALLDFNREKDGPVSKHTPNLANPITTPDIYSVMGQGIGGMYKPYRSDAGILSNPLTKSRTGGGELGFEVQPGSGIAIGVNSGVNWAFDRNVHWTVDGDLERFEYDKVNLNNPTFEPWYFKAAGEMTAEASDVHDYFGGESAVRLKLGTLKRHNYATNGDLEDKDGNDDFNTSQGTRNDRKPRANNIQPITNGQLLDDNGIEKLEEYQIDIFQANSNTITTDLGDLEVLNRPINKPSHLAGMTALQPNGLRYVYGIAAMNNTQQEYSFSINADNVTPPVSTSDICGPTIDISTTNGEINNNIENTNEYLNISTVPEYAHSYLLTSILGADYVDITGDGITDDDMGYWVKFHYTKTSDAYQWKAPFHGANFLKGKNSTPEDDQGAFSYGTREQYYLTVVESKTHIAEFNISSRQDGRGAASVFQNSNYGTDDDALSYQLDNIQLFSKAERYNANNTIVTGAQPIQTIHMQYNYDLCKGSQNSSDPQGGKLTLEKLWFTSENSNRGALSPYEFNYDEGNPNRNPDYANNQYDRWGNYKPSDSNNECENQYFPYADQYSSKDVIDERAAAWHLRSIKLPSGANIDIEYEADDYAYVQDRVAMQMFKIDHIGTPNSSSNVIFSGENPSTQDLRIVFNLENAIDPSSPSEINKYVEDLHGVKKGTNGNLDFSKSQMYFKISSDLNSTATSVDEHEFVEGYAKIASISAIEPDAATGFFTKGQIILKPQKLGISDKEYHPFCASAWQLLRLEFADKLNGEKVADNDNLNALQALGKLASVSLEIGQIFKSYFNHCSTENYGSILDLNKSYIRLNTPDKKKYGGGVRVSKVTLDDNWDINEDGVDNEVDTYGQVYDYTTLDEDGNEISSGVAINEPSIGSDESALKYGKEWTNKKLLRTSENLFFEYPINESYYPGASVGYSKVTVKSLGTHYSLNPDDTPLNGNLHSGFGSTGVTVNEFYTAKDFPVLVEQTEVDKRHINLWAPLALASYQNNTYTGSQGYAITLNDMHGKPRKVAHYGQDQSGILDMTQELNQVVYNYKTKDVVTQSASNKSISKALDNEVEVLLRDDQNTTNGDAVTESHTLGVDIEFFMDMRETKTDAGNASIGLGFNFEPLFFFAVTAYPNFHISESRTRLAVTNKIIRKSAILESVEAYDGQATLITTNEVFDPMTGQALLTSVNNNFDNKVYNYNLPARYVYDGMGEAYKNWGLTISNVGLTYNHFCGAFETSQVIAAGSNLVPGDEFIILNCSNSTMCDDKLVYSGKVGNTYRFHSDSESTPSNGQSIQGDLLLIRSGKRNHLQASAGSIAALSNPMTGRVQSEPNASVKTPSGPENIPVVIRKIDNVLSTGAITYSEGWDLENGSCASSVVPGESSTVVHSKNDYFQGRKGVWRPNRTYAYVTDRTTFNNNLPQDKPNLDVQGVMNNVTLFNWENPFFDQASDAKSWKWTSEITKYASNGEEVENRDVLGIYSSALYGYRDNLSTAVGANTRHYEMGFEGFEEYNTISGFNVNNPSGNFNFRCDGGTNLVAAPDQGVSIITETYNIVGGYISEKVLIDKSHKTYMEPSASNPIKATLFLKDALNKEYTIEASVTSESIVSPLAYNVDLPKHYKLTLLNFSSEFDFCNSPNALTTGKVVLTYCNNYPIASNCDNVSIAQKGHTGEQSLRVDGNSMLYNQADMKLEIGEEYHLSAWVSRDGISTNPTYQNISIDVQNIVDVNGNAIPPATTPKFTPKGEIIEGWQKIEGDFIYYGAANSSNGGYTLKLNTGGQIAYFDDIRIHPKDGNIQTYVYDPADYRLRAVLDQNNFATFYNYDEEGNLFLVKKETERGIKTIQETRQFIKPSN